MSFQNDNLQLYEMQNLTKETFGKAKVIPGTVNKHLEPLVVVFSDTCYGTLIWVHLSLVV